MRKFWSLAAATLLVAAPGKLAFASQGRWLDEAGMTPSLTASRLGQSVAQPPSS